MMIRREESSGMNLHQVPETRIREDEGSKTALPALHFIIS